MQLIERTILITGGTSGIGRELATQLIARGNRVIVTGRDAQRLEAIKRALPGVHAIASDVSDPRAVESLYRNLQTSHPQLDVLVNNAGIMRNLDLLDAHAPDDLIREIEIGLSGPMRMVQTFLPQLLAQPQAAIVNVTSGLAYVPLPMSPVYCAAKAGLHSYTRSLRAQLKGTSVSVFEVAPPGTETPLFRGEFAEEMKGQKPMAPERVVREALAAMASDRWECRPGLANVLYAMSRLAPGIIFGQMSKLGPRRGAAAAATPSR